MPSNEVIIASAGSGKTTELVRRAMALLPKKTAITTFTLNNVEEIRAKFIETNGCVPPEVTIYPWYTFLLHEMARPFQGRVHAARIRSVCLVNGASTQGVAKTNIKRYFFNAADEIYSDKIGEFSLLCERSSGGEVLRRLRDMYDHVFVDEVQDLAGFDIDVLETLLESSIHITLVGDIRQSTFRSNYSRKNQRFVGRGFLEKVKDWQKRGLCKLSFMTESHRCSQAICDLADSIFPDLPPAKSLNSTVSDHDGIFIVRPADVRAYVDRFNPQVLRLKRNFACEFPAINFGASKGLGFMRILIVPYGGITKWLKTGNCSHVQSSAEEVYVAITRARQSVAIIHEGGCAIAGVTIFRPGV